MTTSRTSALSLWLLGLIAAVAFVSCSTTESTFSSLVNKGVMPVSSDNPFVGPNLFLAKEMEGSNYLYSFMKGRGAPRAIELHGDSEQSAEMNLYYSAKGEVFRATPRQDPNSTIKEWIIRGPYSIDRENYHAMKDLGPEAGGVFEIFGRREILGGPARAVETHAISPVFIPTPTPIPTPRPRKVYKKSKAVQTAPSEPAKAQITAQTTPSNFDQEALFEAKQRALSTPQSTPLVIEDTRAAVATTAPLEEAFKSSILKTPAAHVAEKGAEHTAEKTIADLATTAAADPAKEHHH